MTTSTARRRCAWTGVGCAAAWTQVSIWRRRHKHGVGWPPILARAARGTRESGAADASGQRHERRELARVPLWPVAAVVGSVLRGIRTINATASACKRLGNCVSGEWWQSCQRGHLRAAGVGHAAAEVSNWTEHHAPAVLGIDEGGLAVVCEPRRRRAFGVGPDHLLPKDHPRVTNCARVGILPP